MRRIDDMSLTFDLGGHRDSLCVLVLPSANFGDTTTFVSIYGPLGQHAQTDHVTLRP